MTFQPGANLYPVAFGTKPETVEVPHYDVRAPSTSDTGQGFFPIGKMWVVPGLGSWQLNAISTAGGVTSANWIQLSASSSSSMSVPGNLAVTTVGNGLRVAEGTNAKQGVATLVAGTVVVANTSITANSRIFITGQSLGTVTVFSAYGVSARTPGVSFTILASQVTDTSVVAYEIFEPA